MRDIIRELYRIGVVKVGRFVLSSGIESPFYINLRILPSFFQLFKKIVDLVIDKFRDVIYSSDVIVGVATGGIPLASFISCLSGRGLGYVRGKEKGYGVSGMVEGVVDGKKVLIVDDVATTGSSLLNAFNVLRENNADVIGALVLVDREQGAKEKLEKAGLKFYSLWRVREIFEILAEEELIDMRSYKEIMSYLDSFRC